MIHAQNDKLVAIVPPDAIVDDASFTAAAIDTRGWDYLRIIVQLGATDIAMATLKVQESDDDGGADAYADVTGLVFGTSENIAGSTSALPTALEDDDFFVFDIDLKGRERFQKLVATAGNGALGTYMSAFAILSRGSESPVTAAERGASQILRV